ncbi:MAG TPA: hypothetical protein VMS08_02040 [Candidatus Saccharimonadia bacterium]|nr:hypothetical protein [Candidatus Saccharimonadia bacterium]
MATLNYRLTALVKEPDFEAERRYILTEKDYALRQIEKLKGNWWPWFSYPELGIFRQRDWHRYVGVLEDFEHRLQRHEEEIENGLIPLRIEVANETSKEDVDIKLHLIVGHGSIHPKLKAPARPPRMDGAPNQALRPHFQWPRRDGFSRSHIAINPRSISVEFSRLGPHDDALLVNKVLYFSCREETRLAYTVTSRNVPEQQRGVVIVEF